MVDIKPNVIQDSLMIRDKFLCNDPVLEFLEHFVSHFSLFRYFLGSQSINEVISICSDFRVGEFAVAIAW